MDKDDIEGMVKDAEAHAVEDKKRREGVDARNALDSLVYEAEKTLGEHKEKIPMADLNAAENQVAAAKSVLEKEDASTDEMRGAFESLQTSLHKVSQALYQAESAEQGNGSAAADAPPGATGGESGAGEPDVVDAEFTEEK